MRRLVVAAAAAFLFAAPAGAADRLLDLRQPEVVAQALREGGFRGEVKTNKAGEPYVLSGVNGSDFTVEFYACEGVKNCASYQFSSWYKAEPLFTPTFANDWNREKRFLKISVGSDGELNEYMDFTAIGKTTYDNFMDSVDWYKTMDASLARFIEDKRKAAGK